MAADFPTFKIKYPELVSCGDGNEAAIDLCITEAISFLGTSKCPSLADQIVLSKAAHCIAKSGNNPNGMDDSAGAISQASVGSVSVSYEIGENSKKGGVMSDYYNSTPYGKEYLVLLKQCYGAAIMVTP